MVQPCYGGLWPLNTVLSDDPPQTVWGTTSGGAYSAADSDSAGLRWGLDSAFLTSCPVMPVHQDHTEQQGCKELCIDMEKYLRLW